MQNLKIPRNSKVLFPLSKFLATVFRGNNNLINSFLALIAVASIWFGLSDLSRDIRISFIIFALSVIGWCFTSINDTYIALIAAVALTVLGVEESDQFFAALGDSTIWLLLASFIIAAGVTASGLSNRLTLLIANRARSVNQLFFLLTAVLMVTAFIVPATSGRAALMVPIFTILSKKIANKRIIKALALLFPTIILLSAVGSLIGAGAHLIAVEILLHMEGEKINFARWMMLGLPFALVSCFASTWVILRLFLTPQERRKKLQLNVVPVALERNTPSKKSANALSSQEWYALIIVLLLVLFWSTESLHGIDSAIIALLGAIAITAPNLGIISFKEGVKQINWTLLLFLAATLKLGDSLTDSGGAEWLVNSFFSQLDGSLASSTLFVVSIVALVSLFSHLLINSRSARASVLLPLVIILGKSLGYNPTALAFVSTAAAGFCLTLPISAKPVAMFNQLDLPTYQPQDLLRLSSVLLPLHFVLLLIFAFFLWPVMGLSLTN